jgi:signal peptidase
VGARSNSHREHGGHRRVVRVLGNGLLAIGLLIAGALVVLAALARADQDGISRIAGHPVLTVLSDSMTPTFKAGDLIVDRPASGPATSLHVGDAITFRTGTAGHLITHRIVAVDKSANGDVAYRTQGDANNAPDSEPVLPDQVVGVYSGHVPYAGYALRAAHSRTGLFVLIVVPVLALLLPVFRKWWQATAEPAPPADTERPLVAATTAATNERPEGRATQIES